MMFNKEPFYFSAIPYSQEKVKDLLLAGLVHPRINSILFEGHQELISTIAYSLAALMPKIGIIKGCPLKCSLENRANLCSDCLERYYGQDELTIRFVEPDFYLVDLRKNSRELETFLSNLRSFRGIILIDDVGEINQDFLQHLLEHPLFLSASRQGGRFKVFALEPEGRRPLAEEFKAKFKLIFNQFALTREIEDEEFLNRINAFDSEKEKFQEVWTQENQEVQNLVLHLKDAVFQVYIPVNVRIEAQKIIQQRTRLEYPDETFNAMASSLAALYKMPAVTLEQYKAAIPMIYPEKVEPRKRKKEVDLRATIALKGISTLVKKKGSVQALMEMELAKQKKEAKTQSFEKEVQQSSVVSSKKNISVVYPVESIPATPMTKASQTKSIPSMQSQNTETIEKKTEAPVQKAKIEEIKQPTPSSIPAHIKTSSHKKQLPISLIMVFDASKNNWIEKLKELITSILLELSEKYIFSAAAAAFKEKEGSILVPPTKEIPKVITAISEMAVGGKSPLADGIIKGKELVMEAQRLFPEDRPVLLIFTDGKANVSPSSLSPSEAAKSACKELAMAGIFTTFIDLESGFLRFGFAEELAKISKGQYYHLDDLESIALGDYLAELLERESKEK